MNKMNAILAVAGAGAVIVTASARVATQSEWYRGNVHVHTAESDGNSPPEDVAEWYRSHDYDFVFLTDHDLQVVTGELAAEFNVPGRFLLLPGVEVTDRVDARPVHLNGLGVSRTVVPQGGRDVTEAIDRDASAIEGAGGLPVLNHPNGLLRAALEPEEIGASHIAHFEVCCADYRGGSGHPSTEEIWDAVLGTGRVLYGIAADDAHDFGPESREPGTAWVMVRAAALTAERLLGALRAGEFYATTGVVLRDVTAADDELCIRLDPDDGYGYRTHFIGPDGVILRTDESSEPCYVVDAGTRYVRARVERSDGATAWVQPVFNEERDR